MSNSFSPTRPSQSLSFYPPLGRRVLSPRSLGFIKLILDWEGKKTGMLKTHIHYRAKARPCRHFLLVWHLWNTVEHILEQPRKEACPSTHQFSGSLFHCMFALISGVFSPSMRRLFLSPSFLAQVWLFGWHVLHGYFLGFWEKNESGSSERKKARISC